MPLPRFLRFLSPLREHEGFSLLGHIRVERQARGEPTQLIHDSKNFIVDGGLTAVRDLLIGTNGGGLSGSIFRMAVGDGGTPPAELFNPKLPDVSWPARTALFHEILRQDISVFSRPTSSSMRFVGSFQSIDVDPTSFSLSARVINEAALIIGDGVLTIGGDKTQVNKTPPDAIGADERMMSMRTFKSASFDPAEDVTITIYWTITIAKA